MKLVAINEIHYTDKNQKPAVAKAGTFFDIPKTEADQLLKIEPIPPVRRLTADEIELDKLRAESAKAKTKATSTEDEDDNPDADEDGDQGTDPGVKDGEDGAATDTARSPKKTTPAK